VSRTTLFKIAASILAAPFVFAAPHAAGAEDYPARAVTLIIPYPAGGGVDTVGRIIAQKLTTALGQQVIVENRPGAGSVIGTRAAVKAPADGYTLLMITTGLSLSANPGHDVAKDFAPIGTIASIPIVVMANASVPVKTLSDVIALAKKGPGKVTIAARRHRRSTTSAPNSSRR
jgi:tripartite-type tricarboxylate transporter receptor subunit TctC